MLYSICQTLTIPTLRNTRNRRIFFTYQKIQWIWTDGGLSAQDDWGVFG